MKKIGSLVAVTVLVAGLALAWQSQSVAESGVTTDNPTVAKAGGCCSKNKAAETTKSTDQKAGCDKSVVQAGEKAGCGSAVKASCSKSATAEKNAGCPFSTAAATTQPAATLASSEKSGCCPSQTARLASFTNDAEGKTGCAKADKAAGCEKKCCEEAGKTCCLGENAKCDKAANCPKKTGDASACNKTSDKAACGSKAELASAKEGCCSKKAQLTAAKEGCGSKAELASAKEGCCSKKAQLTAAKEGCGSKAELASAKEGCSMTSTATTRPAATAGCSSAKASLASDTTEKKCCSKSKASLAAATQPAVVPAATPVGQSKSCCGSKSTSVVSSSDKETAQPVAQ